MTTDYQKTLEAQNLELRQQLQHYQSLLDNNEVYHENWIIDESFFTPYQGQFRQSSANTKPFFSLEFALQNFCRSIRDITTYLSESYHSDITVRSNRLWANHNKEFYTWIYVQVRMGEFDAVYYNNTLDTHPSYFLLEQSVDDLKEEGIEVKSIRLV